MCPAPKRSMKTSNSVLIRMGEIQHPPGGFRTSGRIDRSPEVRNPCLEVQSIHMKQENPCSEVRTIHPKQQNCCLEHQTIHMKQQNPCLELQTIGMKQGSIPVQQGICSPGLQATSNGLKDLTGFQNLSGVRKGGENENRTKMRTPHKRCNFCAG